VFCFFSSASITASRATRRHIVALAVDQRIFSSILEPMKKLNSHIKTIATTTREAIVESQDPTTLACKLGAVNV